MNDSDISLARRGTTLIDRRSDTAIVINPEALMLELRDLEDASRVQRYSQAFPWAASAIAAATSAGRNLSMGDHIWGVGFGVAAIFLLGIFGFHIYQAYANREKRNLTAKQVIDRLRANGKTS